jgi:hypothetical protein
MGLEDEHGFCRNATLLQHPKAGIFVEPTPIFQMVDKNVRR